MYFSDNQAFQKTLRQRLRGEATAPERILWRKLQGKQLEGRKFRRQYGIENYILDFYCPEIRLAVEVDGDTHFESADAERKDIERERYLIETHHIQFLRFTNRDVVDNLAGVVDSIMRHIQTH
ncbi:MAG: endonuclease domain-containing protein [Patescibacteria group bacterium]